MDVNNLLSFFQATPPRLLPDNDYHRPMIERLLAQTAATDDGAYEERLETYNALCEKLGVPKFDRVRVIREPAETRSMDHGTLALAPAAPAEPQTPAVEPEASVTPETPAEPAAAPAASVKPKRAKKQPKPAAPEASVTPEASAEAPSTPA